MQVNLFISGRKLRDLDTFSKSDPQCKVLEFQNGSWRQIGQTEVIQNNLNPDFETSFTVAYWFEKVQRFKFQMVDVDSATGQGDLIGEIETTMGDLMGAKKQMWVGNLTQAGNANRGQIIVRS